MKNWFIDQTWEEVFQAESAHETKTDGQKKKKSFP
jgi:hypothetical protein